MLRTVAAVALVGAGVAAGQVFVTDRGVPAAPPTATPDSATTSATPDVLPTEVTEFRATAAGFALSYPSAWDRLDTSDPQVVLAARGDDGGSLHVRVIDLGEEVTAEEMPAFRQLMQDLVTNAEGVTLLDDPRRTELAGLPGYFYFYAFEDQAAEQRGVHSHYFLFRGDTLVTIVFQALPATRFDDLAPLFDRVATSFEVL